MNLRSAVVKAQDRIATVKYQHGEVMDFRDSCAIRCARCGCRSHERPTSGRGFHGCQDPLRISTEGFLEQWETYGAIILWGVESGTQPRAQVLNFVDPVLEFVRLTPKLEKLRIFGQNAINRLDRLRDQIWIGLRFCDFNPEH